MDMGLSLGHPRSPTKARELSRAQDPRSSGSPSPELSDHPRFVRGPSNLKVDWTNFLHDLPAS